MDVVLSWLVEFLSEIGAFLILGLIAIDVALGVAVAIKAGVFDWKKIGQFYRTNVVPLLLPYIVACVVFKFLPGLADMLPAQFGLATMFTAITTNLIGSIMANWGKLREPTVADHLKKALMDI